MQIRARLRDRLRKTSTSNEKNANLGTPKDLLRFKLARGIGTSTIQLNPATSAQWLSYFGITLTTLAITYWAMQLVLIPSVPEIASNPNKKGNPGITLYANHDNTAAYDLFGTKPVMTDAIYLRGVVATGKNPNGSIDGFAIFEIDGKPVNAVSVGESLGKGLTLYAISDESATLLYQGQKLEFKLSKPSSPSPKAPKKK